MKKQNTQNTQQPTQSKGIFIGGLVLLGIGYLASLFLTSEESTKITQRVELSQETKNSLNQLSLTGVETDTGKRLETVANSGTNWSMSPFGTGKPLEEIKEEKRKFVKPNTEWKTRTISGIAYVFGEGNPREVALSQTQLRDISKKCGTVSDPNNEGYLCKEGDGYVTPEVENYLKAALSDPNWEMLLTRCEENLRYDEFPPYQQPPSLYPNQSGIISFSIVAHTDFLDINKWIIIDENGRKSFDFWRVYALQNFLYHHTEKWFLDTEYPRKSDGSIMQFTVKNCVDIYAGSIMSNINQATTVYRSAD